MKFLITLIAIIIIPLSVSAESGVVLRNPAEGAINVKNENAIQIFIGNIIKTTLGVVGSIALAMFIYGGFLWMLSAGNNEQVQKGKNVLIWASIGLIIIFSSYTLVNFILTSLKSTA